MIDDETLFDIDTPPPVSLSDRFIFPPFSVLDRRGGAWQERKRRWLSLGIRSELGRSGGVLSAPPPEVVVRRVHDVSPGSPVWVEARAALKTAAKTAGMSNRDLDGLFGFNGMAGHWLGDSQPTVPTPDQWEALAKVLDLPGHLYDAMTEVAEFAADPNGTAATFHDGMGVSVFDPVICELVYRWFSAPGARILDPFAGGSVRGVVASALARHYTGIELRGEQVEANEAQSHLGSDIEPHWIEGDARKARDLVGDSEFDLLFSCPPYADLERYSDDPRDLSAMASDEFDDAYADIIRTASSLIRRDRFAAWVISDVRDKRGMYRGLVSSTVDHFRAAGLELYNDLILVDPPGIAAMAAGRPFEATRKVRRTHQHLLIFIKGDPSAAAQWCRNDSPAANR